ncbi:MAG: hypothetical protein ACMXYF_03550 [Candidatus Woesearchaeota archaeon]
MLSTKIHQHFSPTPQERKQSTKRQVIYGFFALGFAAITCIRTPHTIAQYQRVQELTPIREVVSNNSSISAQSDEMDRLVTTLNPNRFSFKDRSELSKNIGAYVASNYTQSQPLEYLLNAYDRKLVEKGAVSIGSGALALACLVPALRKSRPIRLRKRQLRQAKKYPLDTIETLPTKAQFYTLAQTLLDNESANPRDIAKYLHELSVHPRASESGFLSAAIELGMPGYITRTNLQRRRHI